MVGQKKILRKSCPSQSYHIIIEQGGQGATLAFSVLCPLYKLPVSKIDTFFYSKTVCTKYISGSAWCVGIFSTITWYCTYRSSGYEIWAASYTIAKLPLHRVKFPVCFSHCNAIHNRCVDQTEVYTVAQKSLYKSILHILPWGTQSTIYKIK